MSGPEIIEVLNDQGVVIGTMDRSMAEDAGHVIQNALVFIFDSSGNVWVQLRPKTKKHFPGMWDISACGGIIHGETPIQAAQRELLEEMGFETPLTHIETFMNEFTDLDGNSYKRLSHLFVGTSDDAPVTSEEVDEFQAVPHRELRQLIIDHPNRYIPSFLVELDKAVRAHEGGVR